MSKDRQVVSKARVSAHGEVYTRPQEVRAMLNLVRPETERLESRFLEPACGSGNFLAEILVRKLRVAAQRYENDQFAYERNCIVAISSLYGIDILADNVETCRQRLETIFADCYEDLFPGTVKAACLRSARYILKCNIIHGNALTLETVEAPSRPIVFAEWAPVNHRYLKRRDFSFRGLLEREDTKSLPLFSDSGEEVLIPEPIQDYPLTHFLEVGQDEMELQPGCSELSGEPEQ